MQKTKLRDRIRDAYHAFKYGPTLVKFEYPVTHVSRSQVETFCAGVKYPFCLIGRTEPEDIAAMAERDISRRITDLLRESGAVEIRRDIREGRGMDERLIEYVGRVRVVMPDNMREEGSEE